MTIFAVAVIIKRCLNQTNIGLLYDFDVDTAVGSAGEGVVNNQLGRAILGFGKDEDKEFREEYKQHYSQNYLQASCQSVLTKWKNISYKNNADLSETQIKEWEANVNKIYNHYTSQCNTNDVNCQTILRIARDYYAISHGGDETFLQQMELSMHTYIHGGVSAIKDKAIPYLVEGIKSVPNLGKANNIGVQVGVEENTIPMGNAQHNSSPETSSLIKSTHATQRRLQGRNVGVAQNDLQRARQADIFLQPDGRYVIRGKYGREHIIEPYGEVVTTINNRSNGAHLNKIRNGERRPITEQEYLLIKQFSGN